MTVRSFASLLVASLLFPVAATAQAPDGFRTHDDPALGLWFYYPTDYCEIPLEPTETVSRVKYVKSMRVEAPKRGPRGAKGGTADVSSFEVFVVDRSEAPEPPKPAGASGNPFLPKSMSETETASRPADPAAGAKNLRDAMLAANRVRDFDEFKRKKLGAWTLQPIGLPTAGLREWRLISAAAKDVPPALAATLPAGFCAVKESGDLMLGVFGSTRDGATKEFEAALRRVAKSLRAIDGSVAEADLARLYQGKKLGDVPRRIETRRGLARGWKATDTENFVIVHHTPNERLVNKTARDIEAIRPFYVSLFPPVKKVEAVAVVRLCRDMKEYMSYGAPPGSGGFFHPGNEELVLFDYLQTELGKERTTGRRLSDKDSMIVLYHEAFHQYIHYAVGEIAPHDWFNEGHGDYFSGAVVSESGKVMRIGPSPWRLEIARDLATGKKAGWVPAEKLVRAPRSEYYDPATVGNYYACGWAFVYFLRESPEVAKHPEWSRALGAYFDALKNDFAESLEELGPDATLEQKGKSGAAARDIALKAAFGAVDFNKLESAWRTYVSKLPE
jgi:hypothetical protein